MYQMNNVDIIILCVVGVSALIGLNRGLIKEVLSITGWILATVLIIHLLPVLLPMAQKVISNGIFAGILTSLLIFTVFFIIWIYTTGDLVGKIRTSKLNGLDRFLGLFFGVMRAFLLIVLFNIMVSWIIPEDKQEDILKESKYYTLAGSFAKPLEEMIPQETLDMIKEQAILVGQNSTEENKDIAKKNETLLLFEKLTQPQIKKIDNKTEEKIEESKGYKDSERDNLDRLVESVE